MVPDLTSKFNPLQNIFVCGVRQCPDFFFFRILNLDIIDTILCLFHGYKITIKYFSTLPVDHRQSSLHLLYMQLYFFIRPESVRFTVSLFIVRCGFPVFKHHLLKGLSLVHCIPLVPSSKINSPEAHGLISVLSVLSHQSVCFYAYFMQIYVAINLTYGLK